MIRVLAKKDRITIYGHSQSDVCASVSSAMYTTINILFRYDASSILYEDCKDSVCITILKHDNIIDMVIDNMLQMFEDVCDQAPKSCIEVRRDEI